MSVPFPRLRPYARGEVWAQTADEASAFDARAIERSGVPQPVLMENAGRSAAAVLHRRFAPSVVVGLVGSGNNGGDALVALRTLASWGVGTRAILVADRAIDDPLLHGWPVEVVRDDEIDDDGWRAALSSADVVVDGVLGTGVRGAPRSRQAAAIGRLASAAAPVVSLDVPSGIDASTGAVPGAAVRADVTVAFGAPKLGALLHPARAFVGRHVVVEIGFPPMTRSDASAFLVTPAWARARLPRRATDTHKNRVGRVTVVGGKVGMAGAVVLAARAAFAAGAGLVRVASWADNRATLQAALPEAIFVDAEDAEAVAEAVHGSDALSVGPGMGTDAAAADVLRRLVGEGSASMVLDADALNLAAAGAVDLASVAGRRPLLITPHPGEMGRLLGDEPSGPTDASSGGPAARVAAAVERFDCAVLLKGAPSVVGSPGAPLAVDTQSSSDLAVAGMGDTLCGVCASLAAQGLDPATAASVGLYLSGRAAVLAGRGAGLTPSDVVRWLPDAVAEPGRATSELDLPFVLFDADPAR